MQHHTISSGLRAGLFTAISACALVSGGLNARADQTSVSVNLATAEFGDGLNVHLTSGDAHIVAARAYTFNIKGKVHGTGPFAAILPAGTKISDLLDKVEAGTGVTLRRCEGKSVRHSAALSGQRDFLGDHSRDIPPFPEFDVSASLTIKGRIAGNGQVRFDVTNVNFEASGFSFLDFGHVVFDTGAKLVVTAAPLIQFETTGCFDLRNGGTLVLVVTRKVNLSQRATVHYEAQAITAETGDFRPASGDLSFAPGVREKRIRIGIINNFTADGARTFKVDLSAPTAAGPRQKKSVVVTINDDEGAATLN